MTGRSLGIILAMLVALLGEAAAAAAGRGLDTPEREAALDRIERYLNGFSSVRARFVQMTSAGSIAAGQLYFDRPGNLRFEYDPPHPVLMIADGTQLVYYNRATRQASFVPLAMTPLRFITRTQLTLGESIRVTDVIAERSVLEVTLEDDADSYDGSLTLVFSEAPMTLRKWRITDPDGHVIHIALLDPEFDVSLDRALFDYDDLDIRQLRNDGPQR